MHGNVEMCRPPVRHGAVECQKCGHPMRKGRPTWDGRGRSSRLAGVSARLVPLASHCPGPTRRPACLPSRQPPLAGWLSWFNPGASPAGHPAGLAGRRRLAWPLAWLARLAGTMQAILCWLADLRWLACWPSLSAGRPGWPSAGGDPSSSLGWVGLWATK